MNVLLDPILPARHLKMTGSGRWLTHPTRSRVKDYSFFARLKIYYQIRPVSEIIHVCAHSRYVLYLNGELLSCGPAKGSDFRLFYDSYEIGEYLHDGENHLALEIYHSGMPCRTSVPGIPAFFVDWLHGPDSIGDWQVKEDCSRNGNAHEFTFQIGFCECRDLRTITDGWRTFEDSPLEWQFAVECMEKRELIPRDAPCLTQEMLLAPPPLETGYVPSASVNADYAILLDEECHFPSPGTIDLTSCWLRPTDKAGGAYLIYDFQREFLGSLILDLEAPGGTIVDISFNEALDKGRPQSFFSFTWKPRAMTTELGYRFADRYVLREGRNLIEQLVKDRGGRFMQIVIRGEIGRVKLSRVGVLNRICAVKVSAEFESDSIFLNSLWKSCVHTLRHCMNDTFIDCPWREQAFWINDMLASGLYGLIINQDPALVRRCLKLAVDGFKRFGFMPAVYPAGDSMCFLSMPALWTLMLNDYAMYSGDSSTVDALLPEMDTILSAYDSFVDESGLIANHESWWNFIDIGYMNAGIDLKGHTAILNILIAAAYKCASEMHSGERAERYRHSQSRLLDVLSSRLWDQRFGRFNDSDVEGHGAETSSEHSHSIALAYDLYPERRGELLKAMTSVNAIAAEPYFQRFSLEALSDNGCSSRASDKIKNLWGRMIDAGSPTIWELSRRGPRVRGCESLCHAFSCAPIAHIARNIVGIRPSRRGFSSFSFSPCFSDIVKMHFHHPTPFGDIVVEKEGGMVSLQIPPGSSAALHDGTRLSSGLHCLAYDNSGILVSQS